MLLLEFKQKMSAREFASWLTSSINKIDEMFDVEIVDMFIQKINQKGFDVRQGNVTFDLMSGYYEQEQIRNFEDKSSFLTSKESEYKEYKHYMYLDDYENLKLGLNDKQLKSFFKNSSHLLKDELINNVIPKPSYTQHVSLIGTQSRLDLLVDYAKYVYNGHKNLMKDNKATEILKYLSTQYIERENMLKSKYNAIDRIRSYVEGSWTVRAKDSSKSLNDYLVSFNVGDRFEHAKTKVEFLTPKELSQVNNNEDWMFDGMKFSLMLNPKDYEAECLALTKTQWANGNVTMSVEPVSADDQDFTENIYNRLGFISFLAMQSSDEFGKYFWDKF